jgi:hypothetical protein
VLREALVPGPGDLDARYLGRRATLEPLFASYGMPANSDYAPVLDLNAARHRFTEKSASDVVALLTAGVPVLDMLEALKRRPVDETHAAAYAFDRIESTRLARYARDFLLHTQLPAPDSIGAALEKDLELAKLRLIECRDPRDLDVWLPGLLNVARTLNPFLAPAEASAVWRRITAAPCFSGLHEFQRDWILLFAAVGERDAGRMAQLAGKLAATQPELSADAREYLLTAGMTGELALGDPQRARALWERLAKFIRHLERPLFRLLYCHAEPGGCRAAFARYAVP